MDTRKCNLLARRAIAQKYLDSADYEHALEILKELIKEKDDEDIKKFIEVSLNYASLLSNNKDWLSVANIYKDLIGLKEVPNKVYKNLGLCLSTMKGYEAAIESFKVYEEINPDDKEVYSFIGEIALDNLKDYKLAIEYYEKLLAKGEETFYVYNMLGHLYSKLYRDSHKEEQLNYFLKAYELEPENRTIINNLAYTYGKFKEIQKADEFYAKLLMKNPTHSEVHSYGAFLVKNKRFKAGFRLLRHRFYKEDIAGSAFGNITKHMDKVWKIGEPLKDKRVLLHYEQGFGDSIMCARFINVMKDVCGKVELVLQDSLVDLFKDSGINIPIKTLKELNMDDYDIIIPLMDLPIVFDMRATNIPYSEGYLKVPEEKVKEYKKKYIKKTKKFKIGFAFEGSEVSLETKRDIPIEEFYPLMKMKNVDLYCFQVGDIFKQLDKVPKSYKFTKLGDTFSNWEDTACAVENMDLMITSDNGVMNLAGALGVKTFGVFNSMTEWRWIDTTGNDVAWYKSVKPFQCTSTDDWRSAMSRVIDEVEKLTEIKEK